MSKPGANNEDLFIFFHIPKTGGTSLRYLFAEHMTLNKDFIHLGPAGYKQQHADGLKPFAQRPNEVKQQAKIILGHDVDKDTYKLVPRKTPKNIVFLRNPAARIVSLYNYEMYRAYSSKGKTVLDFDEWYSKLERNNMTKLLEKRLLDSGLKRAWFNTTRFLELHMLRGNNNNILDNVNRALETFWFVGCTEHLDRDIPILLEKIGIQGTPQHHNVSGKGFKKLIMLDEDLEDRLNRDNSIDTELYLYWHSRLDENLNRL